MANSGVYFIRAESAGPIKIGFSSDIAARMRSMQICCPYMLQVLAVVPDGCEADFQRRFQSAHAHGEWFHPTDRLLSFIESLPRLDVPPARTPTPLVPRYNKSGVQWAVG